MNPYIGHEWQLAGIEEHRFSGGRADGMRLYEIRNETGLHLTVSPDRCGDILRMRHGGTNLSYLSPAGFVSPQYFDVHGGFLRSFTAGFLTTCGLENVGSPCTDEGTDYPLHGSIGNIPAQEAYHTGTEDALTVHTVTYDETLFGRKLSLAREMTIPRREDRVIIRDTITNRGDREEPVMILYHMNMGYPLLDEDSVVTIPSVEVTPRDDHAAEGLSDWMHMEKPTPGYRERCFYHRFADGKGMASIVQPKLDKGLKITFDAHLLDGFVEWKMMGVRDYVLGLECGNCLVDGRDVMRKKGMLKTLAPGASVTYEVCIDIIGGKTTC